MPERLDILGYLDDKITLIVIRDGEVVKKYHPVPPEYLKNVIQCKNPRCITIFSKCHRPVSTVVFTVIRRFLFIKGG